MKKITIGRGRECDIRLNDSTDKVSRRQAIITVSPTGKMKIYDTSANGTFVNGERVEKPVGKPIRRGDNVNFARLVDLDWDLVKNPYTRIWTWTIAFLAVVCVVAVVIWAWGDTIIYKMTQKEGAKSEMVTDSVAPVNDSLRLEIPANKASSSSGYSSQPAKTTDKKVTKEAGKTAPATTPAAEKPKPEVTNPATEKKEPSEPAPEQKSKPSPELEKLMKDK